MKVAVLGSLEVTDLGRRLDMGTAKERALFALLVLHAGQAVSIDRLAEELWEGNPPDRAGAALRVYVSKLRRALGDEAGERIVTRPGGYLLHLDPDDLDVSHFERLVGQGHRDMDEGKPDLAAVRLRDALGLWRGTALAEIAHSAAGQPEAARLEELRLAALEARVEADLACGRHAELVGELEALVLQHPWRERLWAARMLALYRAGRQAESLRAFQELRRVLADELGLDPSPPLVALERAVLNHDPRLDLPAAAPTAPPPGSSTGPAAGATVVGVDESVRVVTLLFTDLAESTQLLGRLGDDRFEELRRIHFRLLREAVAGAGGKEVKSVGDGIMVAFASAVDALSAAVAMQVAVARYNHRARGTQLGVRVGVHAGEPVRAEADYFGTPVVVAKRLCDRAEPGQILASQIVRDLVGSRGGFDFTPLGPLSLKGLAEPVVGCEVAWSERSPIPLPAGLALDGLEHSGFLGRAAELAHLEKAWGRAQAGERSVVLVAGEPGIGKTTLAARLASEAHDEGAVVLFGSCAEAALVPFQPFVEAFEAYIDRCPDEVLTRQVGEDAADLAFLLPRLHRIVPGLPALTGGGDETERYRLFHAVPAFLAAITEQAPVLVVLDDLHWADRPTLQLLQHVIRYTAELPLLILGTYRDTDLVRTHPMAEVLVDLRRGELVERLPLRGLSRDDVVTLVVPRGAPEPADLALADALWEETEGSPLFLREIVRHLAETGALAQADDGRWRARRRLAQLGIPEGVKEVIGRRLSRLSVDANAVLAAAAVQGRRFRVDVVERSLDVPGDRVLDALDEAAAAGVVGETPGAAGSYQFTHALVQEALYDELSLTRRVRLHQRAGEALEALHGSNPEPYLAELAHHFRQAVVAGCADKALDYARRAGDHAFAGVAYEAAAAHYAGALEVAEDADAAPEARCDLLLTLGRAQWPSGDARIARATYQRAADMARAAGDATRLGRAALGHAGAGIRTYWVDIARVNEPEIVLLGEALAALGDGDSELRARLLACLAQDLYYAPGSGARRQQLAADALAVARRLGDPSTLAYVLVASNYARWGPDDVGEQLDAAREALHLAAALGDPVLEGAALSQGIFHAIELDDLDTARSGLYRLLGLADALGDPVAVSAARSVQALFALPEGRFQDAEDLAGEAFRAGQEARDPNAFSVYGVHMVAVRRVQGRQAEVVGMAGAFDLWPYLERIVHAGVAELSCGLGDHDTARRHLEAAGPADPGPPRDVTWLAGTCLLGLAAATVGDTARAGALYAALVPYGTHNATLAFTCIGPVAWFLGAMASALGLHDEAIVHCEAALARCRRNGWQAVAAETEMHYAAALMARDGTGDRRRAAELAGEGLAIAAELGMALTARRCEELRDRALGVEPPGSEPQGPIATRRDRVRARVTTGGRRVLDRVTRRRDDDELVRRFGTPRAQRALFTAMARSFQPAAALGFHGRILFELRLSTDDPDPLPPDWWTVEVKGRKATAHRERAVDAAVTIAVELPDFVRLASGALHPVHALVDGRIHVEGDILLAARLADMFGAVPLPADEEDP